MPGYGRYWDEYVTNHFHAAVARSDVSWPGDEWGSEQEWTDIFDRLFAPFGVSDWRVAAEIGQGSGKYTKLVLDAAPACRIVALDVSAEFLRVCGRRLSVEVASGRLGLEQLRGEQADEMFLALDRRGCVGELDAVFSIDTMVHIDLQDLTVYFLTAALCLRRGGYLIATLADATSEIGFSYLVSRLGAFYPRQGDASGKFEWVSGGLVSSVLERTGFETIICDNDPPGSGRDLHVVARLADPSRAYDLSWALSHEPSSQRITRRLLPSNAAIVSWPVAQDARSYLVEFSRDDFATLIATTSDVELAASERASCRVPDALWDAQPLGVPLNWRAIADTSHRRVVAGRGILVRVAALEKRRRPEWVVSKLRSLRNVSRDRFRKLARR